MKEDDRVIVKALTLISAEVPNEKFLKVYLQVLQAGAHEKKIILGTIEELKLLYTAGAVR